jgi:hypothetical protein
MISTAQSRFSKLDFPIQCQSFEKLQWNLSYYYLLRLHSLIWFDSIY